MALIFLGEIRSRKKLPPEERSYKMTVKASLNRVSYVLAPVHFTVLKINIPKIEFSRRSYSVIVSDSMKNGEKIFDLPMKSLKAAQYITYNISGLNEFFSIHRDFGTIKLKRDFSELKLARNSSKKFSFTVIAQLRHHPKTIVASALIDVYVIPAYSGDVFDHLLEKVNLTQQVQHDESNQSRRSEFAFHRFFRRLSPTAQHISIANTKFNKIIRGLRNSVKDKFACEYFTYLSQSLYIFYRLLYNLLSLF